MHIPPINSVAAYSGPFDPIGVQKAVETSAKEPSPFRAWTRGSGKVLAGMDATPSLSSCEAFWAQWPGKRWKSASEGKNN